MSVLSSIPTRFRVVLIGVACLGISLISQAQIVLNVSGGQGGPLTINITSGANFILTGDLAAGDQRVVFKDFWPSVTGSSNFTSSATEATVSLGGGAGAAHTGTLVNNDTTNNDLVLGFYGGTSSFVSSDTMTLSTGTRITGNINIPYTSIESSGNAFLTSSSMSQLSNTVTWTHTAVPEPSTYAAISGLVCLGGAIARRRFKRS